MNWTLRILISSMDKRGYVLSIEKARRHINIGSQVSAPSTSLFLKGSSIVLSAHSSLFRLQSSEGKTEEGVLAKEMGRGGKAQRNH